MSSEYSTQRSSNKEAMLHEKVHLREKINTCACYNKLIQQPNFQYHCTFDLLVILRYGLFIEIITLLFSLWGA